MNTLEIDSYFLNLIQRNILKVYDNGIILNLKNGNTLKSCHKISFYDKKEKITISISKKRLMWIAFHGKIPPAKYVCCKHQNLDYTLYDLYLSENKFKQPKKLTRVKYKSKFTSEMRNLAIMLYEERKRTSLPYRTLSDQFNVSKSTAYDLIQRIKSEREDSKNL